MPDVLLLRPLTEVETRELRILAHGQKVDARLHDRARICWLYHAEKRIREIVAMVGVNDKAVRRWITRFKVRASRGCRPDWPPPDFHAGGDRDRDRDEPDAAGTCFGKQVDPAFRIKGAIVSLYETPPDGSVVIRLDGTGPENAQSHPGHELNRLDPSGAAGARDPGSRLRAAALRVRLRALPPRNRCCVGCALI